MLTCSLALDVPPEGMFEAVFLIRLGNSVKIDRYVEGVAYQIQESSLFCEIKFFTPRW